MSSALTRPDAEASAGLLRHRLVGAAHAGGAVRQRPGHFDLVVQVLAERHARIGRLEQERRGRRARRGGVALDVGQDELRRGARRARRGGDRRGGAARARTAARRRGHRPAVPRLQAARDRGRGLGHVGHRRRLRGSPGSGWSGSGGRRGVVGLGVAGSVVGSGGRCAGWLGGVCWVGGVWFGGCCAARLRPDIARCCTRRKSASSCCDPSGCRTAASCRPPARVNGRDRCRRAVRLNPRMNE